MPKYNQITPYFALPRVFGEFFFKFIFFEYDLITVFARTRNISEVAKWNISTEAYTSFLRGKRYRASVAAEDKNGDYVPTLHVLGMHSSLLYDITASTRERAVLKARKELCRQIKYLVEQNKINERLTRAMEESAETKILAAEGELSFPGVATWKIRSYKYTGHLGITRYSADLGYKTEEEDWSAVEGILSDYLCSEEALWRLAPCTNDFTRERAVRRLKQRAPRILSRARKYQEEAEKRQEATKTEYFAARTVCP